MKSISTMSKIFLIVFVFLFAEQQIQLQHADFLENKTNAEITTQFLVGDVSFRRGEYHLHCDRARRNHQTKMATLKNNVSIFAEGKSLICDSLEYDPIGDVAELYGNVQVIFGDKTLKGSNAWYDFSSERMAIFGVPANYEIGAQKLIGNRIFYDNHTDLAFVQGNGTAEDTIQNIRFTSEEFYIRQDSSFIKTEKHGSLFIVEDGDSLLIEGDTLFVRDSTITGFGNVEIRDNALSAHCRKLIFDRNKKIGTLMDSVVVIAENQTLRTDTLFLDISSDTSRIVWSPMRTVVEQEIVLSSTTDSLAIKLQKTNRLEGEKVTLIFSENHFERIAANGMATSHYHIQEDSVYRGENTTSGDSIVISFQEDSVRAIKVVGGARGRFIPAKNNSEIDTTIEYAADTILFDVGNERVFLFGNASTTSGSMRLTAQDIQVNFQDETLWAYKSEPTDSVQRVPTYIEGNNRPMTGEKMKYHLGEKTGIVWGGNAQFEDGYFRGEDIYKTAEGNFLICSGRYTTCDSDNPHYHFSAWDMKIIPQEKIIARPIVFHLFGLPTPIAAPFGVFPAKKSGRASGWIMPGYGKSKSEGRYLKGGGYFWAPNDYWDARLLVDFYDKTGFLYSWKTRYTKRYAFKGNIETKYTRKQSIDGKNIRRWNVKFSHNQKISEESSLRGNGSFVSDKSFFRENSTELNDRLNQQLKSNLTYTKRYQKTPYSTSVNISRTENLQSGKVTEIFPQLSLNRRRSPILTGENKGQKRLFQKIEWDTKNTITNKQTRTDTTFHRNVNLNHSVGLRYQPDVFGINTNYQYSVKHNQKNEEIITQSTTLRHGGSAGYKKKWFGFLAVNSFVRYSENATLKYIETKYDSLEWGGRKISANLDANTKIYGLFPVRIAGLEAVRHVITPTVKYSFEKNFLKNNQPETNKKINYSLNQLVQTKFLSGEKAKKSDLFTLSNSGTINFTEKEETPFEDLRSSLRSGAGAPISFDVSTTHGFYDNEDSFLWKPRLKRVDISSRFSWKKIRSLFSRAGKSIVVDSTRDSTSVVRKVQKKNPKWLNNFKLNGSVRYSVSKLSTDKAPKFTGSFRTSFKIGKKWRFSYNARLDFEKLKNGDDDWLISHSMEIYRDLHCWEAKLQWVPPRLGIENDQAAGYFFIINVKSPNMKDVKIEKRGGSKQKSGF